MIDKKLIKKHEIYGLSKSSIRKNGLLYFLGKSMLGYYLVVVLDEHGQEIAVKEFSSYSKARSSIGIPNRMLPVFSRKNIREVKCECCGQVLKE